MTEHVVAKFKMCTTQRKDDSIGEENAWSVESTLFTTLAVVHVGSKDGIHGVTTEIVVFVNNLAKVTELIF